MTLTYIFHSGCCPLNRNEKTTMKKSILSIILAIAALTATAQNTYTLNFDPVLLSEELAKENVKIDSFYLRQ